MPVNQSYFKNNKGKPVDPVNTDETKGRTKKINHLSNIEKRLKKDRNWINALRGYAIFASAIVLLMLFIDHYVVAMALMLMMNAWVVMGTFSISRSMSKDLSDDERMFANIKNTALFSTGTFLPIVVIFSESGKFFASAFLALSILSFAPALWKTLHEKTRYLLNSINKRMHALDSVYAYYKNDTEREENTWYDVTIINKKTGEEKAD